jgi:transposase
MTEKKSVSVVARHTVAREVNADKHRVLSEMGAELDRLRAMIWSRFSGAKTAHLSTREVRNRLMAQGSPENYAVPQRLWRATVEDTVDKIRAWQRAVIVTEVRPKIYARTDSDPDTRRRKQLLTLAKTGRWKQDPWLSRQTRAAFSEKKPVPRPTGRIVADNCSYDTYRDDRGNVWLAVMSPQRGRRIRMNLGPLPDVMIPTSTIQLTSSGVRNWKITAAYESSSVCSSRPRNPDLVPVRGIDAGVSEMFTDSDGNRYVTAQYAVIDARGKRDRNRGRARNKLRGVRDRHLERARVSAEAGDVLTAKKFRDKAARIDRHNLGHTKLTAHRNRDRAVTKNMVFHAVHELTDSTAHIVAEKLSGMSGKSKYGPDVSRVYSYWLRSFLAEALASVPSRRGSAVTLVNPAYTSQQVHSCGHLGVRKGKKVHCKTAGCPQQGVVFDSEINAACNISSRATDPDITVYTPVHMVKRILLSRVGVVENCPTETQDGTVSAAPDVSETSHMAAE